MTLDALWADLSADPEVRLKRDLWDGLLREAYGEEVGDDSLFLQHTYLAIVVKTIANRVLDLPVSDPEQLLSGRALAPSHRRNVSSLADVAAVDQAAAFGTGISCRSLCRARASDALCVYAPIYKPCAG